MEFKNDGSWIECPIPECRDDEYEEVAWGLNWQDKFRKMTINRPKVFGAMVKFDLKFCGVCHSDKHLALNEVPGAMYPMVPGHELVGIVTEIGPEVTKVAVGDKVAVGCTCDSCQDCDRCNKGEENYCLNGGQTHTYNANKIHGHIGGNPETQTLGGYSGSTVLHERYIMPLPADMELHKAAPLVCAGITMYDPLRHWGALEPGRKMTIGIAGLGGLGTMGVKLAAAMGHKVVVISGTLSKKQMALDKGASDFVVLSDPKSLYANSNTMDLILNTISAAGPISKLLPLLKTDGTIVQLGLSAEPLEIDPFQIIFQRKSVAGSMVGGLKSLQECIDFCYNHNIYPDVEIIDSTRLEEIYGVFEKGNSGGIRYVLDIEKSKTL
eukprot:sb/3465662/